MYIYENSTSHYSFSLLFTCYSLFHYEKLIITLQKFSSYKKLHSTCLLLFLFSFLGAKRCSKVPKGASNFLERGAQRCSLKLKRCSNEAPGAQKSPKVPQGASKKGAKLRHPFFLGDVLFAFNSSTSIRAA